MEISDQDLLLRAKNNDRHAFSVLVRRYQSPLRQFLRRFCQGDQALADDLAQDAFIKAFHALKGFKGEAAFKTWLYRIAYNVMASHHRKYALNSIGRGLDGVVEPAVHDGAMLSRDVERAIEQLSSEQQLIFYLVFQNGFTHSEVAAITTMPLGTVKSHANRARSRLQKLLSAWQEEVVYE